MRLVTPILCVLLAAAAIARFGAEADHRAAARALAAAEERNAVASLAEHRLRLEVEVLESAGRLGDVNARTVGLVPARPSQLTDARRFADAIGREDAPVRVSPRTSDVIGNAITMADPEAPLAAARGRAR